MSASVDMDKIVSLCKRRGFIFQSSEIYGGLGSAWDYGPLGVELKRNVKAAWWKAMVHDRDDVVGLDASILMHPTTWKASGHTENFTDVLVDCKQCKKRFRQDHVGDQCPNCGARDFTDGRAFNLMLKTHLGAVEDEGSVVYLRPETAQGIFVNFPNVVDVTRRKLPFGIAQIGKSFRNEITPGNFTFRTREFEQMEIEYFTRPEDALRCHEQWIQARYQWYLDLGLRRDNLRLRPHGQDELAHYAAGCTDVEYLFPFGWSELEGIANRTDYDLRQHAQFSGKDLSFQDLTTSEKFYPYIIEPSGGVDRATLAFIVDAYHEEKVNDNLRVVLKLHKSLVPIQVAFLPLLKKNSEIVTLAKTLKKDLQKDFICAYDDTASIGKLYRRQDEIGTFFCVTVDVQSLEDQQVTVRSRDTMTQDRVPVDRLREYLLCHFNA
ncbi:MAG TPA: glycine--tRNA ligase [Candidatus Omnitrophota bacterium]|nr:glycine--tRNA ligase [Candidatus Omnitrophota bacterium]HPB67569.1 glycine--tRNA ligase [Candidatus Omnitrophota bacterium]HQO58823.1 glycine--tRNA ligase [Candidatus Omnitrophota bacterium]